MIIDMKSLASLPTKSRRAAALEKIQGTGRSPENGEKSEEPSDKKAEWFRLRYCQGA